MEKGSILIEHTQDLIRFLKLGLWSLEDDFIVIVTTTE